MDRHNLFTEWSNEYGAVLRRRYLHINVSSSELLLANLQQLVYDG